MAKRAQVEEAAKVIVNLMPETAMRSPADLRRSGGVRRWERDAVAEAKKRALEVTRKMWLRLLERWRQQWYARFAAKKPRGRDLDEVVYIAREIRTLRRALRIGPTDDERREQTRDRVRRLRARRRAAATTAKP
jgi:hypothetical protein